MLNGLNALMEQVGGDAFTAFKNFGKRMVLSALAKVTWETQAQDGHTDKLTRTTIISLLDAFAGDDADVSPSQIPFDI